MTERLTFDTFDLNSHGEPALRAIGDDAYADMTYAFGVELAERPTVDEYGQAITAIGTAKELQQNISHVQEVLGTDSSALDLARGWVKETGLLRPVDRAFVTPEIKAPDEIDVALLTGGVRNWMMRRALRAGEFMAHGSIGRALLVGGTREVKTTEGPDVLEGMKEGDYLREVVRPLLADDGIEAEVITPETAEGIDVLAAAATCIGAAEKVLVVSNAGNWVQNAGQARRAIRGVHPSFDEAPQLFVVSDGFKLGATGTEPTLTHQNPFTALGQIARNIQEIRRHIHADAS